MIALETLVRRWFAFGFVAVLLWAAWPEGGPKRALRFLAIAALISFAAEYASTHTGFPYGRYTYIAGTHGDELYLSNVPLFVPLSFGVVVWAGRALALGTRAARTTIGLAALGALLATMIDLVIDPMTLRGETWFLGELYRFDHAGIWFDVPWSNFGGWLLASFAIIAIDDALGRPPVTREAFVRGRALALGMCVFFVALALVTAHLAIAIGGATVTVLLAAIAFSMPRRLEQRTEVTQR
ncbi:MAG TPA: carotenoid biosynthesis protein [Actinomycetota bacterium]